MSNFNNIMTMNKKIRLSSIFLVIIIFWSCNLESLLHLTPITANILFSMQIISLGAIMVKILASKHKLSVVCKMIVCVYIEIFILTLANHNDIVQALRNMVYSLCLCLVFDFWMSHNPLQLIKVSRCLLEILVYANFITVLIFPNGMYTSSLYWSNWLLGYKNMHINIIFPAILLSCIYDYWYNARLKPRTIILLFVSLLDTVIVKSQMSFCIILLFILVLTFIIGGRDRKLKMFLREHFSYRVALIVCALAYIIIVVLQNFDILTYLIVNIFNKSMSLSGRSIIWQESIKLFLERPIFGYGFIDSSRYVALTGIVGGTHAHNLFLSVLDMGGLFGTGLLIAAYYLTVKGLTKRSTKVQYVSFYAIVLIFIMGLTVYNTFSPFTQAIFILAFYLINTKSKTNTSG